MKKSLITCSTLLMITILTMTPLSAQNAGNKDDTGWKKNWYVNTVWYQIFPDRFFIGSPTKNQAYSEKYDKNGCLIPLKLSDWDRDMPTIYNKYGGDLAGIDRKAAYLRDLGITGVWLNPVFAATSNHRYNASDYRRIDPLLGNREDLCHLVSTLHGDNIHLILDGVFNHTGYEFWAFQDIVRNGKNSPYRDWYYIKHYPVTKLWQVNKGNPASYECWWGVPSLPKLNYANKDVRNHIYGITKMWMACGIDGWRLDVPDEIKYDDFWKEWRAVVKGAKSDAFITGEIWNNAASWVNDGSKFDAVMNYYGFREPVLKYFSARKLTVTAFDTLLAERRALYPHRVNCAMQNLLSSHDTARILSVIQNGDEKDSDKDKKNYDKGPASEETVKRVKAAVLFQMTYVGSPMVYYGDEIGMVGGKDPDCRRPMIWNEAKQNADMLEWHKKLIAIRKEHAALRTGEFKTLITDDKNNVYAFERFEGNERVIVIINYSPVKVEKDIPAESAASLMELLSGATIPSGGKGTFTVSMEPYGGKILLVK